MKNMLIVLCAFLLVSCSNRKINITHDSESDFQIITAAGADSIIHRAAGELQKYIEKISGVYIPSTGPEERDRDKNKIFVGAYPERDNYNPNLVFYTSTGEDIMIGGGSSKSVLYAVYTFLENELGCKWLSPDAELVPETADISLPSDLDYSYTPEIETRTVHSKLYYENHVFADKRKVTHEAFPGYVPGAKVHTFHRFMPGEAFFGEHPEYYALRNGKRLTTQLCLSNPDVLKIVSDSARAYFERYPGKDILSVSQDDNTLYCTCDECRAVDEEEGSPAGSMIRFVNNVAAEFPGKTISTLAYQYTRKPPLTKPADNVLVTLCSIECDRSKPIEEGCRDFASDLKGWKELSNNIRIWDYTTQFTNFLAPFPNIYTLGPNARFFRDNNARWVFEQHSHNPSELFELRSYLTAKLLWNPDLDTRDVIAEFCSAYYGEAGTYVEKYINTIHKELADTPGFFLFLYGDPSQGFDTFLRPEMLSYYNELFEKAADAVAGKPVLSKRINEAGLSTLYAGLEASRAGLGEGFHLGDEAEARLREFEEICNNAGIEYMNEMGYTADEYIASYAKALERSATANIAAGRKVQTLTDPKKYAGEDPGVLTDGALGGPSFYSNWLGYEGNDMEVIIDLGEVMEIDTVQTAFLQVTNHIVFFPEIVELSFPADPDGGSGLKGTGNNAIKIPTGRPLNPSSKVNDIEYFNFSFEPVSTRYVKIYARNMKKAPGWHNASGLPAWIFCDEIIVN